jgi:hypothetical protein
MVPLSPTFICLLFFPVLVLSAANTSNANTDTCDPAHNGLASGTLQFASDCNATTWCNNGRCQPKGCRRDRFPLGYDTGGSKGNGKHIPPPPLCASDEFCPDEGSQCISKINVGEPCQFDRDGSWFLILSPRLPISPHHRCPLDSCRPPPNSAELRDRSGQGLNFNGSICLNFVCQCVIQIPSYTAAASICLLQICECYRWISM